MTMSFVLREKRFCIAAQGNRNTARVGAHPSDFCSGKSHQNHSLCRAWMHKCRDARVARSGREVTLRVPCVPRQSRLKKNSQLRGSNTFLLFPAFSAVFVGVQSQRV
jgi:hypothetical protein